MGIAGFQKWLLSNFPEAVRVQQGARFGEVYDHVAFDVNQILHQSVRKSTNRQTLSSAIFRELDQILKNCIPRKSIFFAFDGPGPLAKLATQRKRRRKKSSGYASDLVDKDNFVRRPKFAKPSIDGLEMTPGVETLYYIRDSIEYWAYSRLQNDRKYRNVDIRISGADVPGEGELKLIDFCRTANLPSTDSVIVVGGDADIVLQGLATVPIRSFFVYLRNFAGSKGKRQSFVISVWEVARTFERLFPDESSSVRLDFILLAILSGNDYIPKVRGLSLSRTWRRYLSLKLPAKPGDVTAFSGHSLVDAERRTLNWPMFYALMDRIAVPVTSIAEAESERQLGQTKSSTIDRERKLKQAILANTDSEIDEQIVYTGNESGVPMDCIVELSENSKNDIILHAADGGVNPSTLLESEEDEYFDEEQEHMETLVALSGNPSKFYDTNLWIRALLWNIQMYVDGYCSDFNFQYTKPYGPPVEEILKYIRNHDGDPFLHQSPMSNATPLLPHQTAMAVLPKHAKNLLPKPLQLMYDNPLAIKEIFIGPDRVNVPKMVALIDQIPKSEYTPEELKRTFHGSPLLIRHPRVYDRVSYVNPHIRKPGPRFGDIYNQPVMFRCPFTMTETPPCYKWPRGSFPRMLELPYKRAGGASLGKANSASSANVASRSADVPPKPLRTVERRSRTRQIRHRSPPVS